MTFVLGPCVGVDRLNCFLKSEGSKSEQPGFPLRTFLNEAISDG